jgi:hypothetical protein
MSYLERPQLLSLLSQLGDENLALIVVRLHVEDVHLAQGLELKTKWVPAC